eukprot:TRINITY_DN65898_c0_g1_i1.p1 TRINITY_DN65898_c0_g1~~TRINITY_DN65898_c0_g1_i1.p1  ORF type:complete len:741 (+),score=192.55 TRINITY_DN65898_c0_g1_i1:100-2223(+)
MAAVDTVSTLGAAAFEVASLVGVELAMFVAAAIVYVAFAGWPRQPSKGKGKGKLLGDGKVKVCPSPERDTATVVNVGKKKAPIEAAAPVPKSASSECKGGNEQQMSRAMEAIRSAARSNDLAMATAIFNAVERTISTVPAQMYNSYLDACIHCGDLKLALDLFVEMKKLSCVDVVSYNTLIKGYLSSGKSQDAHRILQEMSAAGFAANQVTYNQLLNAKVNAKDHKGMWQVFSEMIAANVKGNFVTCSIILKSMTISTPLQQLEGVIKIAEEIDGKMEETAMASIVDACIRCKRLTTLSDFLRRNEKKGIFDYLQAPAYGMIVKAYGEAGLVEQVKEVWAQMQRNKATPSAMTMGCLVEALVINNYGDEAWQIVNEELKHEDRKDAINTVVYSTLLKGFSSTKCIDKVLALYKEMQAHGIECNKISYNTMLDACAKCSAMGHAASLLQDMKQSNIDPDLITYSSVIKGYCLAGEVDRAFKVLDDMKRDGKLAPDEIMFNSLLDGCAKQRRVNDALNILKEMKCAGIKPTNFTLSILIKLLGHSRKLGLAFEMFSDICKENDIKPNIQVYTCLVHACILNRCLDRAFSTYENAVKDGCRLDDRFFGVLAKGCLQRNQPLKAVEVVRAAYRLPGTSLACPARTVGIDSQTLDEICRQLRSAGQQEQAALERLQHDLQGSGVVAGRGGLKTQAAGSARPWQKPGTFGNGK